MRFAPTARPIRRALRPTSALVVVVACALSFGVASAFAETPHVQAKIDSQSCAACHTAHRDLAYRETDGVLAADSPTAGCLACHTGANASAGNVATGTRDSFALPSGHSLETTSASGLHIGGCETCHDSHGASSDGRMLANRRINGVDVEDGGPAVCLACHDAGDSWYGADYPSTSAPTRDATGYPVSGTWTGPATWASDTNAHSRIPTSAVAVSAETTATRREGDCLYCHAAHRGPNAYDALATTLTVPTQATLAADQSRGDYAALCLSCHGADRTGPAATTVDIERYVTSGRAGAGHRIVTAGGTLPVGSPMPCFECHNPHGSKRGNSAQISDELGASLETSSAAGERAFCFTCHTTSDTGTGWDSGAAEYATPGTETVVGLARDGGALHLSATSGHAEADAQACGECHGQSYAAGGYNVHDLSPDGTAAVATDTIAPLTVANLEASARGTVSLVATDTGSGVEATYYSLDGGAVTSGTVLATSVEGTHAVQFFSVDSASNVETPTVTTFTVDTVAPITASDVATEYSGVATITLSATDATGTGVAETRWSLDGGDIATGTVLATDTVGPHTLEFGSVDVAGNVEATQTVVFSITAMPTPEEPPASEQPTITMPPSVESTVTPSFFVQPATAPTLLGLFRREDLAGSHAT